MILAGFVNCYSQISSNHAAVFNGGSSYFSVLSNPEISPSSAITIEAWVKPEIENGATMSIVGKNYTTGYFLGIQNNGRIVFYPKGGVSFRSRLSSLLTSGVWTHIAATYNGAITTIYINGNLDTLTTGITGPMTPNDDSLFIGADKFGGTGLFFYGQMKNLRIWKAARTDAELKENMFANISMLHPTGAYSSMVCSFRFNFDGSNSTGRTYHAVPVNMTYENYTGRAVNFCDYNNGLQLNGITDYCSHSNDNHWFSITKKITLEAWVKRDTTGSQPVYQNIVSKSGGTNVYDYGLYLESNGNLYFAINNYTRILQAVGGVTTSQWTHVAAAYNSDNGQATIFVNGDSVSGTTFSGNPLIQDNDNFNLYLGASGASNHSANRFKGKLDDIKIWTKESRTAQKIRSTMFTNKFSEMNSNDSVMHFTFDYFANGMQNGGSSHVGGLSYYGSAKLSSSHYPANSSASPVMIDATGSLANDKVTMKMSKMFIPDNDPNGIKDSVYISDGEPVQNLKLYLFMNHTYTGDLTVQLISPDGQATLLLDHNSGGGNDAVTVFSDNASTFAASTNLISDAGSTASFSPTVRPVIGMSVFNNKPRQGWWKLKIIDNSLSDRGYLIAWGLNLSNIKTLKLTSIIQGFYKSITNTVIPDTIRVLLRRNFAPYDMVDSAKGITDANGYAELKFRKPDNLVPNYAVIKHRNSLETWSLSGVVFRADTLRFDMSIAKNRAYGSNQIQVDSTPAKYAIYSGDITGNNSIDLGDINRVYNAATAFKSGYVDEDVTGDKVVQLNDLALVYNNAANFVTVKRP